MKIICDCGGEIKQIKEKEVEYINVWACELCDKIIGGMAEMVEALIQTKPDDVDMGWNDGKVET